MSKTPTVCVIDDDPSVRKAVCRLLETLGYTVSACESAEQFLYWPTPPAFDCLIVDIRMPGLSGLDLLDALNLTGRNAPVILMSGYADARTSARAAAAGAVAVLAKPFEDAVLIEALHRATGRPRDHHRPTMPLRKG
jgi:FixJ family two-component response regulator